jgi:putative Holliday junction resolvase
VVGYPLDMDGHEGAQARVTREWAEAVAARLALPLALRDERLSSVAAEAALGAPSRGRAGGPPSPAARDRRRAAIDREAARRILQAELDARSGAAR